MMKRRSILLASLLPMGVPAAGEARAPRRIASGAMTFAWRHEGERLHGRVSAPGPGWLAVGFNAAGGLRGTRFVIAAVSGETPRAEVHVALVPEHVRVEDLGGTSGLDDVDGAYENGLSVLGFSLPHVAGDRHDLRLAPGERVTVMLAYSQSPDFGHHSTFRVHIRAVL